MSTFTKIIDTFKYRKKINSLKGEIDYKTLVHGRDVKIAELQNELDEAKSGVFKEEPVEDKTGKPKKGKKKVSLWEAIGEVGKLAHDFEKRMPDISGGMDLGVGQNQQNELDLFGNRQNKKNIKTDADVKFEDIGYNINKEFQPENLFNTEMTGHNPFDIGNGDMFGIENEQQGIKRKKNKHRRK